MDARLHQKPVGTNAGLAGIAEFSNDRAFHSAVNIGIVKHNKGRIAAKLHRDFFQGLGALFHQQFANRG